MKTDRKFKIFSSISLGIIAAYFILNSILVLEWLNMQGTLSIFADIVFFIDLFTWHIYGLFALISFIIKVCNIKKFRVKSFYVNTALHFVFMTISFFEIYHMIQNAF